MRLIMPGAAAVAILLATGLAASAAVPSPAQDRGPGLEAPATGAVVLARRGADDRAGDDRGRNRRGGDDRGRNHRGGDHRGGHDDGPNHG